MTVLDLLTDSLTEIRAARAGDAISADDADLALRRLNGLLDLWNADGRALWCDRFVTYPITPGHQPHTIGPSTADFTVTTRPTAMLSASLLVGAVWSPLTVRDAQWWAAQMQPALSGPPTDLYYQPDSPNGSIYLWPVPSGANYLELQTHAPLVAVALTDDLTLAPGYARALMLTLAEDLATPFGQQVSPMTVQNARQARATIFANNTPTPRLQTADYGLGRSGTFDYQTGTIR